MLTIRTRIANCSMTKPKLSIETIIKKAIIFQNAFNQR